MPETDLETRLRVDAHRTIEPPDLDAALVRAASARPRAHATHPSRWLAAAAAVVVVIAGASALRGVIDTSDEHAAGASVSVPRTVGFVSRVTGVVLLPGDPSGRSIVVYATAPGKRMKSSAGIGYGCVDSTGLKIMQGAAEVSLVATAKLRSDGRVLGCVSAGYQDLRTGEYLAGHFARLDQPLGQRSVLDQVTGKEVAVFRPAVPSTGYLPYSYAPQFEGNLIKSTNFWYDERPGFLSPIAVATEYKSKNKGPRLGVINAPTDAVNPGGKVLEHVQVGGHDATVTDSPHARCVTWSPDGRSGRQVCSYNAIIDPLGNAEKGIVQLDTNELVKVARGLS